MYFPIALMLLMYVVLASSFQWNGLGPVHFDKMLAKRTTIHIVVSTLISTIAFDMPSNADFTPAPWSDKVQYEVVKSNPSGEIPKIGEMVAVRFKGSYKGTTFDDTFNTEQPYYYRAGVGLIVKGLDDTIVNMHVGDRYKLKFGGDMSFENGKPSKPGSPRIPPKADLEYEVEFVELPGKGDDFIADYE